MVNIELLEKEMQRQGVTDEQMAKIIKKDLSTWYRRKNAPQTMLIGEVENIQKALNIKGKKASVIFLS